jgi:hypothetical protein
MEAGQSDKPTAKEGGSTGYAGALTGKMGYFFPRPKRRSAALADTTLHQRIWRKRFSALLLKET